MNIIQLIEHFLYQVSTALYLPVIGVCALLLIYVPLQMGAASFDAWCRWRGRFTEQIAFRGELEKLKNLQLHGKLFPLEVERLLQAHELATHHRLDRVRFVIKIGPALGLMGTLIPMGISLAALAEGNIPKMAGSMVTAFTATVAGLGSGVLAYLVALLRERWCREDAREMAYSAELAIAAQASALPHHALQAGEANETAAAA